MAKICFLPDKCTGCSACAVACMDQNDIDVTAMRPYRWIEELEQEEPGEVRFGFRSNSCVHCENPPCVAACPVECLFYDKDVQLTRYNNEACLGCKSCASVCPHDAISFFPDGKIGKCDGCAQRQQAGLIPACVRVCPRGALVLLIGK